jgi:hypothetical protein
VATIRSEADGRLGRASEDDTSVGARRDDPNWPHCRHGEWGTMLVAGNRKSTQSGRSVRRRSVAGRDRGADLHGSPRVADRRYGCLI